jgi:hypothetical protein
VCALICSSDNVGSGCVGATFVSGEKQLSTQSSSPTCCPSLKNFVLP